MQLCQSGTPKEQRASDGMQAAWEEQKERLPRKGTSLLVPSACGIRMAALAAESSYV